MDRRDARARQEIRMAGPEPDYLERALDVVTREDLVAFLLALATSVRAQGDGSFQNVDAAALIEGLGAAFKGSTHWRATWDLPPVHDATWSEFAVQLTRALVLD
jgi:hypothetical protein